MESKAIQGSCLCGAVHYKITKPIIFFKYCHCSRCQKNSGTAHAANILVKTDQFQWTQGEQGVTRFELPTAKFFCTAFCNTCGSNMPWKTKNEKYYLIPAGSLDEDPEASPSANVFWKYHAPWYKDVADLPKHEEES
ncbi:MAG: GFA family protein [Deltaproteobacteria bacterium]|nr:GFA family protein [Deltaproteobacteria bacterium]